MKIMTIGRFILTMYVVHVDSTTSPSSLPTIYSIQENNLGVVPQCTMMWAKPLTVNNRTYCVKYELRHPQSVAKSMCKAKNAKLPMPKDQAEFLAFRTLAQDKTGYIWTGFTLKYYARGYRKGTKIIEQTLMNGKDEHTAQVFCVQEIVSSVSGQNGVGKLYFVNFFYKNAISLIGLNEQN